MKKLITAALVALGVSGAAEAATYNVNVTAQPFRETPTTSGLQTRANVFSNSGPQDFTGANYSFNLTNAGDTFSTGIYTLVGFEATPFEADDFLHKASNATFNFGALGTVVANGVSFAVSTATQNYALAQFMDTMIRVSADYAIKIHLADTTFATDGTNYVNGAAGKGAVVATFTLAAVPLPATLPLGLGALALMGFVARRRKDIAAV